MRRRIARLAPLLTVLTLCIAPSLATGAGLAPVDPDPYLPPDLLEPRGRSSWDLSSVTFADGVDRDALARDGESIPERRPAFWTTVGTGTARLPSAEVEVTVQSGVVLVDGAPGGIVHRFVNPRLGLVARISGTLGPDGESIGRVERAEVLRGSVDAAADLKLYVDEVNSPVETILNLGYELGSGVMVSELIANNQGVVTMGDLLALDFWDFSPSNFGNDVVQTSVPLVDGESCNFDTGGFQACGFHLNDVLGRQDRSTGTDMHTNTQISELEDRTGQVPPDFTIWLRAGHQREGVVACFGAGESGFCYEGLDPQMNPRTPVPLWRFLNQDTDGWFLQAGDAWSSGAFACEQNLFNTICGDPPPGICFTPALLRTKACGDNTGTQSAAAVKGGVVKLPSGHTLNAMVVRQVADFCVYGGSDTSCAGLFGQPLQQVRTVVYLWQVPHLGTVVLTQTDPTVEQPDTVSFTELDETNINYGLFPPRTIAVRDSGAGSVDLWWDPGNDTHRTEDYRIYWDTDSGAASAYAFDSVTNAGQVAFNGTTATVSGLAPATTYYFTVTARASFPTTCVGGATPGERCVEDGECGAGTCTGTGSATTYESPLFPTQVVGDPGFVYPIEVRATTSGGACAPTQAVSNLLLGKVVGGGVQFGWDASGDPCIDAYDVLAAGSPELSSNFAAITQTPGLQTSWTGDPPSGYFLVVGRGTGGAGP